MSDYSEDNLIEQPAIELLGQLGWEPANCFGISWNCPRND